MCVTQDAAKKAEEIIGDMVRTLASATATIEPGRSLLTTLGLRAGDLLVADAAAAGGGGQVAAALQLRTRYDIRTRQIKRQVRSWPVVAQGSL
eukprot:COSAG04_NODE_1779_length_5595_cov_1.888464_1_plen_93_part_00